MAIKASKQNKNNKILAFAQSDCWGSIVLLSHCDSFLMFAKNIAFFKIQGVGNDILYQNVGGFLG